MRVLATIALCAVTCLGQSFNIDINTAAGVGLGPPTAAFGGAAGQPGTWNALPGGSSALLALVDLGGAPTAAAVQRTTGTGGNFNFNNAGTSGDFELLMDDGNDETVGAVYTFSGLVPGSYRVTTYAWAPDGTFTTGISVSGSTDALQCVGGNLTAPNTFSAAITHAVHNVTTSTGSFTVNVSTCVNFRTINGFQIEHCPNGFTFAIRQAAPGAVLEFNFTCGNPGWYYFTGLALVPGAFPNGAWFGIEFDQTLFDLVILSGPPLFGFLDANGNSFGPLIAVPAGIPIWAVGITADPAITTIGASAPINYITQ